MNKRQKKKRKKMKIEVIKKLNNFLEMDWTDEDMDRITDDYVIHSLSTCIFDSYNHTSIVSTLSNIEENFPEYYVQAMEGFILGNHDT